MLSAQSLPWCWQWTLESRLMLAFIGPRCDRWKTKTSGGTSRAIALKTSRYRTANTKQLSEWNEAWSWSFQNKTEKNTCRISGVDDVNLSDVKLCRNKTAKFKMSDSADTLTITNKNCHHLNLVKLKKNKSDNTITLDIITLNCGASKHRKRRHGNRFSENHPNVFKFSFLHQLSVSTPADTPHDVIDENNAIHGIRVLSLFWIILLNVTSIVSYASSKLNDHGFNFL